MFFRLMSFIVVPFIKSTGRFKTLFWLQFALVANLLGLAALGSWIGITSPIGGAAGCAIGVAVGSIITGIVAPVIALLPTTRHPLSITRIMAAPLVLGSVAAAVAWAPGMYLPDSRVGALTHLAIGSVLGTITYVLLACLIVPARVHSTLMRLRPIAKKIPFACRGFDFVLDRLRSPPMPINTRAMADPEG
jgi:hypothetical protein